RLITRRRFANGTFPTQLLERRICAGRAVAQMRIILRLAVDDSHDLFRTQMVHCIASRTFFLARMTRDVTVPIGIDNVSATSRYDISSTSTSNSTSRNGNGND